MSTIEERVKKIVAEQLGVKEEEVTNEKSFVASFIAWLIARSIQRSLNLFSASLQRRLP